LRFSFLKKIQISGIRREMTLGLIAEPEVSTSLNFEALKFKLVGRLSPVN